MEFRILGPLEVVSDAGLVDVSGGKPRALLGLLLVHANRVVSRDRLIDDLWDGAPPRSATATLQTYVSQLRRSLRLESLHTRSRGYVLEVETGGLDALAVERTLQEVARAVGAAPDWIAEQLEGALSRWRGPTLADFEDAPWARAERTRLDGLRLSAIEDLLDARLEMGEHAAIVVELESLASEHPLRERFSAQLMTALYRCDRQADALRAYARLRRHLGEELGIDPSEDLARLEQAILLQEPELHWRGAHPARHDLRSELPSGTVTFLFTDIVDSAALWELQPDAMKRSLARHEELLRASVAVHGGFVVKTTGDGIMAAFTDASSGIAAAIDAQRSLGTEHLPVAIAVRAGLHTGEARAEEGDYRGPAINRAARIAGIAHGGQILVSETTASLVDDGAFRDLGEHRLRGVPSMRLFQVVAPELRSEFPPLAAVAVDLPTMLTTFIGRRSEIDEVVQLVEGHRLVTLTGPGGCGKTRLAIEIANELGHRFSDGVRFADLAAVSNPARVADAVASSLGLANDRMEIDPTNRLRDYLADRAILCVLDNCEHVLQACATLSEALVGRTGASRVLATSREPLGVVGEQVFVVPALDTDAEGVRLFTDRASEVLSSFFIDDTRRATIAEICERLDGMPLAIELAAVRVTHLSPAQILDRLDDRLRLLSGARRLPRHRTLEAALAWSHDLLDERDRIVLRRLSVFPASFSLEATEAVAGTDDAVDALGSLVEKSLVQVTDDDERFRYRLLETVRMYARAKLSEAGEYDEYRSRHRDWIIGWLESLPLEERWFGDSDRLTAEYPNLRAALEWSDELGDREILARLAAGIDWYRSDDWREGARWCGIAAESAFALPLRVRLQLCVALWLLSRNALYGSADWAARRHWVERAIEASRGQPSPPLALALTARGAIAAIELDQAKDELLVRRAVESVEAGVEMSARFSAPWRMYCGLLGGMTYSGLERGRYRDVLGSFDDAQPTERHYLGGIEATPRDAGYEGLRATLCVCLAVHRMVSGDADGAGAIARKAVDATSALRRFAPELPMALALVLALEAEGEHDEAQRELLVYDKAARRADWSLGRETVVLYGGMLAALREDWEEAARLLAAGERCIGRPPLTTALLYQAFRDRVRAALSPMRSRALREEGRALDLDAARQAAMH